MKWEKRDLQMMSPMIQLWQVWRGYQGDRSLWRKWQCHCQNPTPRQRRIHLCLTWSKMIWSHVWQRHKNWSRIRSTTSSQWLKSWWRWRTVSRLQTTMCWTAKHPDLSQELWELQVFHLKSIVLERSRNAEGVRGWRGIKQTMSDTRQ